MTRTWMNSRVLESDTAPWPDRLCVAVDLENGYLMYITEGGHIEILDSSEGINMPEHWIPLHEEA